MLNKAQFIQLLEQEVEDFIQTQAEKVISFEDDPMEYILNKYPSLDGTLADLLTNSYRDYITGVYVMAPKPTTFKVLLHNGQHFYLIYAKDSYIAKIAGKKYYLLNIGEEEYAIKSIAELLTMGTPPGAQGPDAEEENTTNAADETSEDEVPSEDEGGGEEELAETKEVEVKKVEKPIRTLPLKFKILKESVEKKNSPLRFRIVKEAKKPFEYLNPESQKVGNSLKQELGLEDNEIKADNKNRIILFTDRTRSDVFKSLADLGYERDSTMTGSSGGGYKTPEGVEIIHKNQTSLGNIGLENEDKVVNAIKESTSNVEDLTVIFKSKDKELIYKGVTDAKGVGRDTGDNKKADILIIDSKGNQPISIKKDGLFRWSSAMKTHGYVFDKIMGDAFDGKMDNLKLVPDEENKRLLKMTNPSNNLPYGRIFVKNVPGMDLETLAFGSDNAAIVQRSFEDSDFNLEGNTLTITSTKIFTDIDEFSKDDQPIIQFERNASKATKLNGYKGRGITIRTVPISIKNKETERANNLTLDWNDIK